LVNSPPCGFGAGLPVGRSSWQNATVPSDRSPLPTLGVISVADLPLRRSGERKPLDPGPAKREREIVEAAVNLFHEAGYAGTSVEHVARAVGMLKGSLYHYIDSKEDLLYRIVEQVHEDHSRTIAAVAARRDLPPLERLQEYVRQRVLYSVHNRRWFAVYWQDRERLSPERYDEILRWRGETEGFLIGLINEAIAAGELPTGIDAKLATKCVRSLVSTLYTWYQPADADPDELAEFATCFVVEGIRGTARLDRPPTPAPRPPTTRHKRKRRLRPA
jgi:AcrR family transcriptional regulator